MDHVLHLGRRLAGLVRPPAQAVLAAFVWLHLVAPPVFGECFGETDPWPSFRDAIPTAGRIVVGEVVASDGGSTGYLAAFRLRVQHVVRGPIVGSEFMEVVGLTSGLPPVVCADSVATLLDGDVVAIAFDARGPDGVTAINTLAFVDHAGPSILTGVEDIDMVELRARAAADDEPVDASGSNGLEAMIVAALVAAVAMTMVARRRRIATLFPVVALLAVGACDVAPAGTSPPEIPPSPVLITPADATAAELESARSFRTTFGLRADDDWIRMVEMDPDADRRTFGVSLLPFEIEAVIAQNRDAKDAADVVRLYGDTVGDDWAGMYIDQQTGGMIVVRFKANIADHERALRILLPIGSKIDVRRATWTERELRGFMAQVEAERDWFPTIGTSLMTVEIAGFENLVDVRFDGHDPGAAKAIEAHFGDPPWLRAVWNGPGDWTGPRGDLLVVTVDSAGRPVPDVSVFFEPQDVRVPGDGDLGWTTGVDGRLLRIDLPAVTYRLRAVEKIGEVLTTLGEVPVTVPPDGRTSVRLIVQRP